VTAELPDPAPGRETLPDAPSLTCCCLNKERTHTLMHFVLVSLLGRSGFVYGRRAPMVSG